MTDHIRSGEVGVGPRSVWAIKGIETHRRDDQECNEEEEPLELPYVRRGGLHLHDDGFAVRELRSIFIFAGRHRGFQRYRGGMVFFVPHRHIYCVWSALASDESV